jgi:hypothetical protein
MATDIEEVYRRYPEAKISNDQNMELFGEEEFYDPHEQSCFDRWMKVDDAETELYNFFYSLADYDGFLLKNNEITPFDYMRNESRTKQLMKTHLHANLDDIWWVSDDDNVSKWSDFHIQE